MRSNRVPKCRRRAAFFSLTALFVGIAIPCPPVRAADTPAYVDMRPWQTPVRAQHGNNCFIYATVAALEARLNRDGHGALDLSEAFSDYMGALFFLETCEMDGRFRTDRMRVPRAGERESSLAVDRQPTIESASPVMRLRIPEETAFPYLAARHQPSGPPDSTDPFWSRQYDVGAYNLDPRRLPRTALEAPLYYGIEEVVWLKREEASDATALERVLAKGYEVIWDFKFGGDTLSHPWRFTVPPDPMGEGHRMLLVGYDRRDPANPYFIAKNSWGPTTNPGARGFTHLEYAFLRYGEWASYIESIKPPAPWPELRYLGRWNAQLGKRRGTLDLYHLPGLMREVFEHNQYRDRAGRIVRDQRLGTFYEDGDPARAFHVNGNVSPGLIQLWIDFDRPTRRWDELTGSLIELRFTGPATLSGRLTDPRGRTHDALATLAEAPANETPATDAVVRTDDVPADVRAEIMLVWQKEGGTAGPLGSARGDIIPSGPDAWMQAFERGKISYSRIHGAAVITD